jgi:hypothetical protein
MLQAIQADKLRVRAHSRDPIQKADVEDRVRGQALARHQTIIVQSRRNMRFASQSRLKILQKLTFTV